MTIDGCVAEWDRIATMPGVFYCNELNLRCSDPQCRDCSTFAASGLNAGFPGSIDPCSNSFFQADWCFNTARPDWFSKRFGPGQGTFITRDQAQHVVCLAFHGSDFGRRPDWSGDGHVECVLGNGLRTVGAHSHATGVGYNNFGLSESFLEWFAVPPCFLTEMAGPPIDIATLEALKKLHEWQERVAARPLAWKQTNGDVTILNNLLIFRKLMAAKAKSNTYTRYTRAAVHRLKQDVGFPNTDGRVFGQLAAHALLHAAG